MRGMIPTCGSGTTPHDIWQLKRLFIENKPTILDIESFPPTPPSNFTIEEPMSAESLSVGAVVCLCRLALTPAAEALSV